MIALGGIFTLKSYRYFPLEVIHVSKISFEKDAVIIEDGRGWQGDAIRDDKEQQKRA
jgi:hypothetical protein